MEQVQDYSINNLKVHSRNNEFFDDISGADYEQFKTSIQNEGILTPLIVSPDLTIISGHQRFKAASELGFTMVPVIIRHDIQTEEDKIVALLAANFGRHKNDDKKQRKVADEYAKLRGNKRGTNQHSRNSQIGRTTLTQDEIAKELGIAVSELNRMLAIERKLTPEIKQMLDDGIFTKNTAAQVITKLSKDEQTELITVYGSEIIKGITATQMQTLVDKVKHLESENEDLQVDYEDLKVKAAQADSYRQELSALKSRPVKTEMIEKEVIPADYEALKAELEATKKQSERYRKELYKEDSPFAHLATESKPISEKHQSDMQGFQSMINLMVGIMADPNHFDDAQGKERDSFTTIAELYFQTVEEFRQKLPELMKPKLKEPKTKQTKKETAA
jgi:hypothetical protein